MCQDLIELAVENPKICYTVFDTSVYLNRFTFVKRSKQKENKRTCRCVFSIAEHVPVGTPYRSTSAWVLAVSPTS